MSTRGNNHTAGYLAEEMKQSILTFGGGPHTFIIVIGDNAVNVKEARQLIEKEFPNVVSSWMSGSCPVSFGK
jgi:hypothetical protein